MEETSSILCAYLYSVMPYVFHVYGAEVEGQMLRKELAVHKEMVGELRQEMDGLRRELAESQQQLTSREKELKVFIQLSTELLMILYKVHGLKLACLPGAQQ